MQAKESVFEQTYKNYLHQLSKIAFESVAPKLGAEIKENSLKIHFFTNEYTLSAEGITHASGKKPSLDVCVILSKYVLRCPPTPPKERDWVTFRNFKDSGPLIGYFTNDVEHAISKHFSGRLKELKKASAALGGYAPALEVTYDAVVQFDALPMIPVILLFNNADEEFPATCSLLFEARTEKYLDAESIAMLGRQLFSHLKKALKRQS